MGRRSSNQKGPSRVPHVETGWIASFWITVKQSRWNLFKAVVIIAIGLWVFGPAMHGQWIGDDTWYLVDNPLMNDPARIWKAWFQPGSWVEYYPIEETVQWWQWQLWHTETWGYHATNVVLHLISALLVWRLFHKLGLPLAWLGGLIFVVHPMTVDSVALINELKTSLAMPPFLLALCAWVDYQEEQKAKYYGLSLGFFTIAMLCKISMATFPVAILLYAWWKRSRIGWADLRQSVPFFAVALVLGLTTIHADTIYYRDTLACDRDVPKGDLLTRVVLCGQTIAFYFSRSFWPICPMPIYPQWKIDSHSPLHYLPWLMLAVVTWLLWRKRNTWGRHALFGLGFFIIMLMPFLGLKWISFMNATWILEHLLYIPMLGLIGLIVAGLGDLNRHLNSTARAIGIGFIVIAVDWLAAVSHAYAEVFKDEATIASYNLRYNPHSSGLHNNLGVAMANMKQYEEARTQFEAALAIDPNLANARQNLGNALLRLGKINEALDQDQILVQLKPGLSQAHRTLGDALMEADRVPEAIAQYEEAVKLDPNSAWMHYNLGLVLRHHQMMPEAIEEYKKALAINPDYAEAHNSLGIALYLSGRIDEARQHLEEAVRINPAYVDARNNLVRLSVPR